MSTKKVKRTWWSKKEQKYITKTYEYTTIKKDGKVTTTSRTRRSKLIVGKNGIYEDRLKAMLDTTDDISVKAEIKAKVREAVRKGENLSTKSLLSKVADSRIEKMFINAGYTEPEILAELGIDREDLFNQENWDGSTFYFGGKTYDFVFGYTGNVLVQR